MYDYDTDAVLYDEPEKKSCPDVYPSMYDLSAARDRREIRERAFMHVFRDGVSFETALQRAATLADFING